MLECRDLGSHICTGHKRYTETITKRIQEATLLVKKIARIPIEMKAKSKAIRTFAWTKALYRCETAAPHDRALDAFTTAIKDVINGKCGNRADDLTYVVASSGTDLDPRIQILFKRVITLR